MMINRLMTMAMDKLPLLTPQQVIDQVPTFPGILTQPFGEMSAYEGIASADKMTEVIKQAGEFFTYTGKFINFITHPILIVSAITGVSYWVCLLVGACGLIFYIAGYKKGLKYAGGSILVYLLLQTLNKGLSLV